VRFFHVLIFFLSVSDLNGVNRSSLASGLRAFPLCPRTCETHVPDRQGIDCKGFARQLPVRFFRVSISSLRRLTEMASLSRLLPVVGAHSNIARAPTRRVSPIGKALMAKFSFNNYRCASFVSRLFPFGV